MQKASPEYTLLILTISTPLQVGLYRNGSLQQRIVSERKISESLNGILMDVMDRSPLDRILYVRGPGSYMAIKLTYIMLRTLQVVRGIPFAGCSAFSFNGGRPVKAIGSLYFVKEKETIITRKFDETIEQRFELPETLAGLSIDAEATPDYLLPAVSS